MWVLLIEKVLSLTSLDPYSPKCSEVFDIGGNIALVLKGSPTSLFIHVDRISPRDAGIPQFSILAIENRQKVSLPHPF